MHPYENLFNEAFKHQIRMLQNRSQFQTTIARLVHTVENAWKDRLISSASQLSGADVARMRSGRFTGSRRIAAFKERMEQFVAALTSAIQTASVSQMRDVAEFEAMFWADRYRTMLDEIPELDLDLNTNTKRAARAGILGTAVITLTVADRFSRYRRNRTDRLIRAVTNAAQTNGMDGILGLFRVSRRDRARGRIFGETNRSILTGAKDLHTHAVSQGAKALVDQNPWMDSTWTAMMDNGRPGIDGKTSNICISRNGLLVNRDLGGLIPPAHPGCRSQIFASIDYTVLSRSQKKALDSNTRMVLRSGVPNMESSTIQFRALSEADQRELLGPTRFDLFKNGGLEFPRDFINARDERRYTLREIALRENIDIQGLG